ncbi:hypothetical protein C6P42_003935, partial [Pichia californica]
NDDDKNDDDKNDDEPVKKIDSDIPPPVPTRPKAKHLTQTDLTISQLVDMFPDLDPKYIKMALIASEGRLEPASNALLFLSDPNSGIEIPIYKNPIEEKIEESDEALARRLAKAYERGSKRATVSGSGKHSTSHVPTRQKNSKNSNLNGNQNYNNNIINNDNYYDDDDDDDDDDYEDIYDSFTKNVNDAKQVVGGWFGNVAKKFQETVDSYDYPPRQDQNQEKIRYNPNNYNHYNSKPLPSRNPYQQPQSVQKGYYTQQNEYITTTEIDEDAPKLPDRKLNIRSQQPIKQKFSAVTGNSSSDVENTGKIILNDTEGKENSVESELDEDIIIPKKEEKSTEVVSPNPIDKDDLYSTTIAKITMNKKSSPTTAVTTSERKPSSPSNRWNILKSINPEPSNDAFLVDDSEDEEKLKF